MPTPRNWRLKSGGRAALAMTLALTLCSGGCAKSSLWRNQPLASVSQGPLGNAVLATLPPGTVVQLPDAEYARSMRSLLAPGLAPETATSPLALELGAPLKICTPAYIAERDLQELALMQQIERLNQENTQLRLKP